MSALTDLPLDPGRALAAIGRPEHGGTALFVGTTRKEADLREVRAIEYEAHDKIAETEIALICDEAHARFGAVVFAEHRLGTVGLGEPSVIVAASAPHRPEAFAACRYLIDELKRRVPIWKRIHYADGATEWIDGTAHTAEPTSAPTG